MALRDYDATGQMLGNDPKKNVDKDPFGFTGGLDAGNGKWKLGARFYDSSKSAFMQQDRYLGDASDPLSLNRYSYCGLDPVNFVDPTGFNAQAIAEFAGGSVAVLSMLTGAGEIVLGSALVITGSYLLIKEVFASSDKKTNSENKQRQFKKPKAKVSGKEGAKDIPSWAKGNKPYTDESGNDFAGRLCNDKYGKGNYEKGPRSDYNKIKKWGDRAFE